MEKEVILREVSCFVYVFYGFKYCEDLVDCLSVWVCV